MSFTPFEAALAAFMIAGIIIEAVLIFGTKSRS